MKRFFVLGLPDAGGSWENSDISLLTYPNGTVRVEVIPEGDGDRDVFESTLRTEKENINPDDIDVHLIDTNQDHHSLTLQLKDAAEHHRGLGFYDLHGEIMKTIDRFCVLLIIKSADGK